MEIPGQHIHPTEEVSDSGVQEHKKQGSKQAVPGTAASEAPCPDASPEWQNRNTLPPGTSIQFFSQAQVAKVRRYFLPQVLSLLSS